MRPSELNILIAIVTSYLYENLSNKEFVNLGVFLSILSREMLSMEALKNLLEIEELDKKHTGDK